jgi:predicted  nucleic acid-binding Zn-ribbon protein
VSTTGAEILAALQDEVVDMEQENSHLRRQISQQGQLLKQTRDRLKITEGQLARNNVEMTKLQREVDRQQTAIAELRSVWQNLDIDPLMEGSRWMSIRLESQKGETERYVQAQLNSERQIARIEEVVQRALEAQTPVALASGGAPSRTVNGYDPTNPPSGEYFLCLGPIV